MDYMKSNKIGAGFLLFGLPYVFAYLSTGQFTSLAVSFFSQLYSFIGAFILFRSVNGMGRVASGIFMGAVVVHALVLLLSIFLEYGNLGITGEYSDLRRLQIGGIYLENSLWMAGQICFLFYKPLARLRVGWIILLLFSPIVLTFLWHYLPIPNSIFEIRYIVYFAVYLSFMILVYPARSEARSRVIAFWCMFTGFAYSLNILFGNSIRHIVIAGIGTMVWLIGVLLLRGIGYERKGSGAFLVYGILMLLSLGIHLLFATVGFFLPGIVGDALALLLQLPAYIILCIGFFRFAKTNVFEERECGMRTLGGGMIIGCILAVLFLIPVVGKTITSWGYVLLLFPLMLESWKNAFKAAALPAGGRSEQAVSEIPIISRDTEPAEPTAPLSSGQTYKHLTEEEKREHRLGAMSEDELREIIRLRTRYSVEMREAAQSELDRRKSSEDPIARP